MVSLYTSPSSTCAIVMKAFVREVVVPFKFSSEKYQIPPVSFAMVSSIGSAAAVNTIEFTMTPWKKMNLHFLYNIRTNSRHAFAKIRLQNSAWNLLRLLFRRIHLIKLDFRFPAHRWEQLVFLLWNLFHLFVKPAKVFTFWVQFSLLGGTKSSLNVLHLLPSIHHFRY